MPLPVPLNVGAGMPLARRIGGKIRNPHVDAKIGGDRFGFWLWVFNADVEIPLVADEQELRLPLGIAETLGLVFSHDERNDFATDGTNLKGYPINPLVPVVLAV